MVAFNGSEVIASLYNVSSNQWYPSTARVTNGFEKLVTAVTDPTTGLIYVAGATNNGTQMVVYNPVQDSVNLLFTPIQGVRSWTLYRAVWSPRTNSILYHGGEHREGPSRYSNSIVQYTPAKDEWKVMETTGSPPPERVDFCMAIDEEGSRLVVFAGRNAKITTDLLRDIFILNLKTWVWTQGRPYPHEERLYHVCTIVGSTFFSWAGEDSRGTVARPAILYDLNTLEYPDTFDPNSSSAPPSKIPLIIGSTVGVVGMVSLIVGVSWYLRVKKKRAASVDTLLEEEEEDESKEQNKAFIPGSIGLEPRSSYAYQPVQASYAEGVSTESNPNRDHQNSSNQRHSGNSQTQPLVNPNQGLQSISKQHYSGLNQMRPPVNPQYVPDGHVYYNALEDLRSPQQLQHDVGDPRSPHQPQHAIGNPRSPHQVHHNMEGPWGPHWVHHNAEDPRGPQQIHYSTDDPRGIQQIHYSQEDPRGPQQIHQSMQYP
ncbi:hypothetical protein BGW38_005024 [Lunasporangiospora selenospora]|uniref:Kelch motif-containing protein n=1 Tax=Lunasporangiospora selenospora TaxID=979761 RepID=A0A9P6FZR6_9FUNG|nr:hypothetical protein BGW38_005024 [Lunasporangiospora selenospora]